MRRPYFRNEVTQNVTRYSYPIKMFSGIDAESKEDLLPLNYAVYGYNIAIRNGVLTSGIGIEEPNFDGSNFPTISINNKQIIKMYFYKHFDYQNKVKNDRIIALLHDNSVYQGSLSMPQLRPIEGMTFESRNVTFFNYYADNTDYVIGVSDIGEMILYDGIDIINVTNCPNLSDACVHMGRIYGIVNESSRIYFSALLDPTNWNNGLTEGGYITMTDEGGMVKRIVSFKDSLYIFREYAIYKLTAYADQTEFALSKVYVGDSRIYDKTVVVCGDRIVFCADDGFHSFDGYICKKILRNIFPIISDNKSATACYFNRKYYFATKITTDENLVGDENYVGTYMENNAIIICDMDLGEVSIFRGADIKGFMPVSTINTNKLFVYFNNYARWGIVGVVTENGKMFEKTLLKKWVSPTTNFETLSKDKVLKRIYISSTSPLTLTAKLDTDVVNNINASCKAQMVPINRRADKIGIVITTNEDRFAVNGMLLEFDLIRRRIDE
ncbi:MAG TPA: hypothetical protein VJ903_05830 [Clostridia bacterium]|nr:hypothetical protein [Clostridia bacterium]